MKKFIVLILLLSFSASAQDYRVVRPGVEYAESTREIAGTNVRMNLLRLDLTKVRIDVVHAFDAAIGVEKTSSIAARHGALAAINAGFFRLDNSIFAGDAAGILQIDNVLLSESFNGRTALFINNNKDRTYIGMSRINVSGSLRVGNKPFAVGINRERAKDDAVYYDSNFGRTTLTQPGGIECVVVNGRVTRVIVRRGSTPIPANGFVVSASGNRVAEFKNAFKIGTRVRLMNRFDSGEPGASMAPPLAEDIVGGVPRLVRNGKVDVTWQEEKSSKSFFETKHPRTAVALLKDGKFLMITVDGRSESSGGIGLEDLAKLLIELGATDAMNLDGGGSTTMYLDGKVVNHPSDKEGERKVSDALLVFPRE